MSYPLIAPFIANVSLRSDHVPGETCAVRAYGENALFSSWNSSSEHVTFAVTGCSARSFHGLPAGPRRTVAFQVASEERGNTLFSAPGNPVVSPLTAYASVLTEFSHTDMYPNWSELDEFGITKKLPGAPYASTLPEVMPPAQIRA